MMRNQYDVTCFFRKIIVHEFNVVCSLDAAVNHLLFTDGLERLGQQDWALRHPFMGKTQSSLYIVFTSHCLVAFTANYHGMPCIRYSYRTHVLLG